MSGFAFSRVLFALGAASVLACSSGGSGSAAPPCSGTPIDRFKELSIVDDAVVSDPRAKNATDGAWSFRNAVENMSPPGSDPGEFVSSWFSEWVTDSQVNGYAIPDAPQIAAGGSQVTMASAMKSLVLCPWMRATPTNGCNADCSACTASPAKLDLAVAPFRLLAVVNRMDLRVLPGINPRGEGRLVFGLTSGPGDDPSSVAMSMTVILEYELPPSLTTTQWADTWHALGGHSAFDASYMSDLQALTDQFVLRGAMPGQPNGSALSQARTNENVLFWAWQMRQFEIGTDGQMHAHTLRNTPDPSFNGSSVLAQYIQTNQDAIQANNYLLPDYMLSGTADELLFNWSIPGSDTTTQTAFSTGTCNGCHSEGLNEAVDTVFHVSPFRSGIAKLSPFENNPQDPTHDDLAARTALLQSALCGQ